MHELLLKPLECNNSISKLVLWFSIYLVYLLALKLPLLQNGLGP